MATWSELSSECRSAARDLRERRQWRASLNRAYYAVFSEIAAALLKTGVTMPRGQEGPSHAPVVNGFLLANHLSASLTAPELGRLIFIVSRLYGLRILADYSPSVDVAKADADLGLALMFQAIPLMEKVK